VRVDDEDDDEDDGEAAEGDALGAFVLADDGAAEGEAEGGDGDALDVVDVEATAAAGFGSAPKSAAVVFAKLARLAGSSTMMPMRLPTGTPEVPSLTRIFARKPSSCISKSTDALSVSIMASVSPGLMASPSFLCHFAMPPWVIVGDKAGKVIFVCGGSDASSLREAKAIHLPRAPEKDETSSMGWRGGNDRGG